MFPLRVALSGRGHGPDIGDILNLLGKDRCTDRVRKFSAML
jgi:glutamyl/glutaminyl-tRNA synthetase